MSTESRLARLGLLHLKDDPVALQKAMDAENAKFDAKIAEWHKKREKLKAEAAKAAAQAPKAAPAPAAPDPLAERANAILEPEAAQAFLAAVKSQPALINVLDALEQALDRVTELQTKKKR